MTLTQFAELFCHKRDEHGNLIWHADDDGAYVDPREQSISNWMIRFGYSRVEAELKHKEQQEEQKFLQALETEVAAAKEKALQEYIDQLRIAGEDKKTMDRKAVMKRHELDDVWVKTYLRRVRDFRAEQVKRRPFRGRA